MAHPNPGHTRNNALVDKWSFVHLLSSAALALLMGPLPAFVITLLWEPLEIFIISPVVARFGVAFGHESLRNSLSDICFNILGVLSVVLISRL